MNRRLHDPPARLAHLSAANDNAPRRSESDKPTVRADWLEVIPLTTTELDILETYLGDVVAGLAANDNEPEQD